ncbi:MAG: hypothetical protein IJD60_05475 [Clostridia bacterium]|nr:hypothetical protein [Clostridia bacterium]
MNDNTPVTQHVSNLSRTEAANLTFRMTVERKKKALYYVVLFLLYFCVILFTFLGTMWGFPMLILTLGTLFFAWYYKGCHSIVYDYEIDGYDFCIRRLSGLRQYTKNVLFVHLDLHDVIVVGAQGSDEVAEIEARFQQTPRARRVEYLTSAHDPDKPGIVMYANGIELEQGYLVKVYLQPSVHLINTLRKLCPGKVYAREE